MKALILATCVVATVANAARSQEKITKSQASNKLSIAIIQGKRGHGSGFVVAPNVVATCAHVIRGELLQDIRVKFVSANGDEVVADSVQLLHEDKERDLALLRVPTNRRPLRLFVDFEADKGRGIHVIGNPGQPGAFATVNAVGHGTCDAIAKMREQTFFRLKIDGKPGPRGTTRLENSRSRRDLEEPAGSFEIFVGPGNSGGPVFDDSGAVIGVLARGLMQDKRPTGVAFCVPAGTLKKAVADLGPESEWSKKITLAAAIHTYELTLAYAHLSATLAEVIVKARVERQQEGTLWDLRGILRDDQMLVKLFTENNKAVRDGLSAPSQTALKDASLTAAQREGLRALLDDGKKLSAYAKMPRFSQSQYSQFRLLVKTHRQKVAKLREKSGFSSECIDEMLGSLVPNVTVDK